LLTLLTYRVEWQQVVAAFRLSILEPLEMLRGWRPRTEDLFNEQEIRPNCIPTGVPFEVGCISRHSGHLSLRLGALAGWRLREETGDPGERPP
jgi:hypothetical protein